MTLLKAHHTPDASRYFIKFSQEFSMLQHSGHSSVFCISLSSNFWHIAVSVVGNTITETAAVCLYPLIN